MKESATLLVGLGGFGVETLAQVRKLYQDIPVERRVEAAFLGFDQDELSRDAESALGPDEFFHVHPQRVSEVLRNLGRQIGGHSTWREVLPWLPDGDTLHLIDAIEPGGARQYRMLGRLGLFVSDDLVERSLRQTLGRLRGRARCLGGLRIFVIASMAGGTGSGMLFDVAYLCRRLESEGVLFTYLALPEVFGDVELAGRGAANAAATLAELISYRAQTVDFEGGYERIGRLVIPRGECELLARVFFFGEAKGEGDRVTMTRERLACAILAQLERTLQRATIQTASGTGLLVDNATRSALAADCCSTSGAVWIDTIEWPTKDEEGLLVSLLGTLGAAGGGNEELAREVTVPEPTPDASRDGSGWSDGEWVKRWALRLAEPLSVATKRTHEKLRGLLRRSEQDLNQFWSLWSGAKKAEEDIRQLDDLLTETGEGTWHVDPVALGRLEVWTDIEEGLKSADERFLLDTKPVSRAAFEEALHAFTRDEPAEQSSETEFRKLIAQWKDITPRFRSGRSGWLAVRWRRRKSTLRQRINSIEALFSHRIFERELRRSIELRARDLLAQRLAASAETNPPAPSQVAMGLVSAAQSGPGVRPLPRLPKALEKIVHEEAPQLLDWYKNLGASITASLGEVVSQLRDEVSRTPLAQWLNMPRKLFLDLEGDWEQLLSEAISSCCEDLFELAPQNRRQAFLIVLVPENLFWPSGMEGLRKLVERAAQQSLRARCRFEVYPGKRLWLYHEDLLHSIQHLRSLKVYCEAYRQQSRPELFHIDHRLIQDPGFHNLCTSIEPIPRQGCCGRGEQTGTEPISQPTETIETSRM